jgi:hypothetical protein
LRIFEWMCCWVLFSSYLGALQDLQKLLREHLVTQEHLSDTGNSSPTEGTLLELSRSFFFFDCKEFFIISGSFLNLLELFLVLRYALLCSGNYFCVQESFCNHQELFKELPELFLYSREFLFYVKFLQTLF